MGHGTSHTAKISYSQMQSQMNDLGYDNVFIGTVEGKPEDTACEAVIEKIKEAGYKKSSASSADGSSRRPCK
ncbi:MAG: sirohydrochlorin cobaltochelatase [Lachnospiraceae bacterium]